MSDLALALLVIVVLFGGFLAAKQVFRRVKFCAICLAVSATWTVLLLLFWFGKFDNQVLLAILMGQSSLGLYYLLEKQVIQPLLIFRLPLLASLVAAIYTLLTQTLYLDAVLIVAGLWLVFGILYLYRTNPKLRSKAKAIIDCCSDW
jgi:predicted membrane channel-forming protein YqfA (hemolysin III family)